MTPQEMIASYLVSQGYTPDLARRIAENSYRAQDPAAVDLKQRVMAAYAQQVIQHIQSVGPAAEASSDRAASRAEWQRRLVEHNERLRTDGGYRAGIEAGSARTVSQRMLAADTAEQQRVDREFNVEANDVAAQRAQDWRRRVLEERRRYSKDNALEAAAQTMAHYDMLARRHNAPYLQRVPDYGIPYSRTTPGLGEPVAGAGWDIELLGPEGALAWGEGVTKGAREEYFLERKAEERRQRERRGK